jgi:Calcineurin-like phosphoesterase
VIERTAVIGDIHGTFLEFQELLELVDYKSPHVKVILAGDIIDRGPLSAECVRLARELDLPCVLGNHEAKFLKWLKNKGSRSDVLGSRDKPAHYYQLSDDDANYVARMPLYLKLEPLNTIVVHAGLRAGTPLEKQTKDDLCYIRFMDEDKKFVSLRKINQLGSKEAAGAHFWTQYGPWGYNVVYGHHVHSMADIKIDCYDDGTAAYGIDTGSCFGGKLSALILETKEVIQVQAKRIYYQSNFEVR